MSAIGGGVEAVTAVDHQLKLAGAVLTGGASRRMGETKALIEIDGVPMASLVAQAVHEAGGDPVVAVGGNGDQLASLAMTVIADGHAGEGPLAGVISALTHFAQVADHVLIVACDLPDLAGDDLLPLVAETNRRRDLDVVVARTDQIEPACAVWRTGSLDQLLLMFADGERALHAAIGQLRAATVPVGASAMRNINSPVDLDR